MSQKLNKQTMENLLEEILSEEDGFTQAEIIEEGTIMIFKCTEKYIKDIKDMKYTFIKGTAEFLDKTIVEDMEILFNKYDYNRFKGEVVGKKFPMIYSTYPKTDGTTGIGWKPYYKNKQ